MNNFLLLLNGKVKFLSPPVYSIYHLPKMFIFISTYHSVGKIFPSRCLIIVIYPLELFDFSWSLQNTFLFVNVVIRLIKTICFNSHRPSSVLYSFLECDYFRCSLERQRSPFDHLFDDSCCVCWPIVYFPMWVSVANRWDRISGRQVIRIKVVLELVRYDKFRWEADINRWEISCCLRLEPISGSQFNLGCFHA